MASCQNANSAYAAFWLKGDPTLTFAFDKTTGKNGDKVKLTITALIATPAGSTFLVVSKLGTKRNMFAGMVSP